MRVATAMLLAVLALGCATNKQRMYVTVESARYQGVTVKGLRAYCTQRETVVGKGLTTISASGICGSLDGKTVDTGMDEATARVIKDVADVVSKNLRPGGQIEGGLSDALKSGE